MNRWISAAAVVAILTVGGPTGTTAASAVVPLPVMSTLATRLVVHAYRSETGLITATAERVAADNNRLYPWTFEFKAKVKGRIVHRTASATMADGGAASVNFPKATKWVAARDQKSGWKRVTTPPVKPGTPHAGRHHYMSTDDDSGVPFRWNPCEPHPWKVTGSNRREWVLLRRTFAYVSAVTGMEFPEVTGRTPADIEVNVDLRNWGGDQESWGGPEESTRGSAPGSVWIIHSGSMDMNINPAWPTRTKRYLYLHELGHVLNLGHTPIRSEVMYPEGRRRPPVRFRKHDLATLRTLDRSRGCLNPPPAPRDVTWSLAPGDPFDSYPFVMMVTWVQDPADPAVISTSVEFGDRETNVTAGTTQATIPLRDCRTGSVTVTATNVNGDTSSTPVPASSCAANK